MKKLMGIFFIVSIVLLLGAKGRTKKETLESKIPEELRIEKLLLANEVNIHIISGHYRSIAALEKTLRDTLEMLIQKKQIPRKIFFYSASFSPEQVLGVYALHWEEGWNKKTLPPLEKILLFPENQGDLEAHLSRFLSWE